MHALSSIFEIVQCARRHRPTSHLLAGHLARKKPSCQIVPSRNLLHLVIGGELTDLEHITFKDLDQVEIVGVFPNYATAHAAWKAKAQQTVDNAHMRYFVVHLHRLLDPGQDTKPSQLKRLFRDLLRSSWVQRALGVLAAEYLRLVWLTNSFSFRARRRL